MESTILVDQYGKPFGSSGNPLNVSLTDSIVTDSQSNFVPGMDYNGATFDRHRGNISGTILPSASRTAGPGAQTITNYNGASLQLILNVTAASGTGGLIVSLRGVDPVSGTEYTLIANPSAVIATGIYVYEYGKSVSASVSGSGIVTRSQIMLPRTMHAVVIHSDGSSYTYSLGYALNANGN